MHKLIPDIKWITLLLTLFILPGCGYHLRQSAELPASISPIMINGLNIKTGFGREMAYRLKSDTVQVTEDRQKANTMLRISSYRQKSRTITVDGSAKVAQTELKHPLSFDLLDATGKILVPKQDLKVVRNFINTEEQKLGKITEAEQLSEGMRQELIRMIMLRIKTHLK